MYNGVDLDKFFSKDNYTMLQASNKKLFKIGCIGNFWPSKGQILLLKAVSKLEEKIKKNIQITFIGTGPTKSMIMDYAKSNFSEKDIVFIDNIDHNNLLGFYNSLNLFVLPSYYEALGCVYLEAAACGTPFIGVKGQGIDEWIPEQEKDLFLSTPKNINSLSDLIQKHYKPL